MDVFGLELEERAPQGLLAHFVVQPGVHCLNLVGIQLADIVDADVVFELLSGVTALLEEVGAEPDLLEVGLVRVLSEDLLDGNFSLAASVDAEPDYAEASPAQECHPFEFLREPVPEFLILLCSQHVGHVEIVISVELDSRVLHPPVLHFCSLP